MVFNQGKVLPSKLYDVAYLIGYMKRLVLVEFLVRHFLRDVKNTSLAEATTHLSVEDYVFLVLSF